MEEGVKNEKFFLVVVKKEGTRKKEKVAFQNWNDRSSTGLNRSRKRGR